MTNASIRSASGGNAKKSRWAGVRSSGLLRNGAESWRRPFRRTERAIDSTERLIERSRQLIDACETFVAEHPIRATRDLQRASGLIAEATERLGRGIACMNETSNRLAEAPANAGDAPARMTDAMARWIVAAQQLAMLSNRLDETFAELFDYVKGGNAPLDLSELLKKRPAPRPVIIRHPSPKVLSVESGRIFRIHVRRQRSARVTVAEAPRRIFRGRAPPLVSTC
jgi:hypothetical protein